MNRNDFYYIYMKMKGYSKSAIINELEIDENEYGLLEEKNTRALQEKRTLKARYFDIGKNFLTLSTNMFKTVSDQQNGVKMPNHFMPNGDVCSLPSDCFFIQRIFQNKDVFSFGNLFPIFPIFLVNDWHNIASGIYMYDRFNEHFILLDDKQKSRENIKKAFVHNKLILEANIVMILIAQPEISAWRYQQKGYRFCLLEAGMLLQKMQQEAANKNYKSKVFVNYMDEMVLSFLNLDFEKHFVVGAGCFFR